MNPYYLVAFCIGLGCGAIPFGILWLLAEKSVRYWRDETWDRLRGYAEDIKQLTESIEENNHGMDDL